MLPIALPADQRRPLQSLESLRRITVARGARQIAAPLPSRGVASTMRREQANVLWLPLQSRLTTTFWKTLMKSIRQSSLAALGVALIVCRLSSPSAAGPLNINSFAANNALDVTSGTLVFNTGGGTPSSPSGAVSLTL